MWSPSDITRLAAVLIVCLAILVFTGGVTMGIVTGAVSTDKLGEITALTAGGGAVGFLLVLFLCLRAALRGDSTPK